MHKAMKRRNKDSPREKWFEVHNKKIQEEKVSE
jgi:hypothetical protein